MDKDNNTTAEASESQHQFRLEDLSQEQLDELVRERDRLRDERERLLRAAADAENRAKTAHKDVQESYRQGVSAVARDIITGLDSLDMALTQLAGDPAADTVLEGVRSVRDELLRVLARHGINAIRPEAGEELDPHLHQAMMEQQTSDIEPGRIASVAQVGYTLHDRVLRPAKVIVAARPTDTRENENQAGAAAESDAGA